MQSALGILLYELLYCASVPLQSPAISLDVGAFTLCESTRYSTICRL